MNMSVDAQEQGCPGAEPAVLDNPCQGRNNDDLSDFLATRDTAMATPTISLPPELRAMTATFNTAELLEHILRYLPAMQLLKAKATCRNFRNAIEISPSLRREMSTFIRLGDVDLDDLFKTDAGCNVTYPIKGLDSLAFFYPSDAEKRLFVRFQVADAWSGRLGEGSGFGGLRVVDQSLDDVTVGWHCSCFEEQRSEDKLVSEGGMVTFGDVLKAMETKHRSRGRGACGSLIKFWLDGLWERSKETSDK
jgi:hypothetical protein